MGQSSSGEVLMNVPYPPVLNNRNMKERNTASCAMVLTPHRIQLVFFCLFFFAITHYDYIPSAPALRTSSVNPIQASHREARQR